MVRTRKRFYGEEVSQSSSNGKRKKKSKVRSFLTFDMSNNRNIELVRLLQSESETYMKLLEQVCIGEDQTMGTAKRDTFWINFASRFCQKTGLEFKEGMEIACQHYCDDLKQNYNRLKRNNGPLQCETWGQMNRIFGGCTSTGRSLQSRRSTSSSSSVYLNKSKLHDALSELAYSGHLDFDAIEGFKQYVTKSKTRLHIFVGGSKEYRASVVHKYLQNDTQVLGTQL